MDSTIAPAGPVENSSGSPHSGDRKKLQRARTKGGWNAALFIIFVEMAERFAFYGLSGNLITYLTDHLHQPLATAAKNVNTWVGVSSVFPVLGALIADSYLGRFTTILLASVIYFIGMVMLALSVSVVPMRHREAVFFTALYVLAVGEGGHKPCVQTFAADQFDEEKPEEKAAKSSFFNWWYLGIVFGASAAVLLVIYIQDNVGWTVGLGILAGALAVALLVFLLGMKTYRKQAPVGSPYTRVAQVVVAAARKRRVDATQGEWSMCTEEEEEGPDVEGKRRKAGLGRTSQFRFLDRAAVIDAQDAATSPHGRDPWRLCSVNQVEEVKLVLRLIPIWLSCIMFTVVLSQNHTFYVKQASTMQRSFFNTSFTVPPASLQGLIGLTILITVPLYDRVLVPLVRRHVTGHPSGITLLQRIGAGLALSVLEATVAALVESRRLRVARRYGLLEGPKGGVVPMQVWWLVPQYAISGMSDAFTIVGLQELFYDQMPVPMRSMGAAAYISVVGVGSFVNTGVIMVVQAVSARAGGRKWLGDNLNRASLDKFYWVLVGMSVVNFCVYLVIARGFVYKKVEEHGGDLRGGEGEEEKEKEEGEGKKLGFIGGKLLD